MEEIMEQRKKAESREQKVERREEERRGETAKRSR
jgi:hypothetical protein